MKQETCYNIPMCTYSYPIELYGRIFHLIVKELWYYSLIIFISFIFLILWSASSLYYSLSGFLIYTFVVFFMIAWHEFGHAVIIIHKNYGIVNMDLKFSKIGLLKVPSIVSHGNNTKNSQNKKIVLGGVVATVVYNPLINILIYGVLNLLLPKEVIPDILFFISVPFLIFLEYLSSNQSSDIYKLKRIYKNTYFTEDKFALLKDVVEVMKIIAYYCIITKKYNPQV